jgi:hypothetical protein
MTAMTMTLPLARATPLYIPQRDLVLGSSDSLSLTVTIVESDTPTSPPIELTGGIGGPACTLAIWSDGGSYGYRHYRGWDRGGWYGGWYGSGWYHDYGWGTAWPGSTLWTGTGTIDPTIPGSFDIFIPVNTMGNWPRRCGWGVLFDYNGGGNAELIAQGRLQLRPMIGVTNNQVIMLTDTSQPVLTDAAQQDIMLDGF